jgi:hypothetical protein
MCCSPGNPNCCDSSDGTLQRVCGKGRVCVNNGVCH